MTDDKSKTGGQDRSRVSANEDYEIQYLQKKFNCSREEVMAAIKAVGNNRDAVEAYLSKKK
jgi:hypothetical protein